MTHTVYPTGTQTLHHTVHVLCPN